MIPGADPDRVSHISLVNAVLCVDCEIVSNSPYQVCSRCGSKSLISLGRLLGGSLRSHRAQITDKSNSIKYNLELAVKVYGVAAVDLNRVIDSVTHLSDMDDQVECLHLNVESVIETAKAKVATLKIA
jgi:hypothetical protein